MERGDYLRDRAKDEQAERVAVMSERSIWLRREESHVVVCVEAGGNWVEVIREPSDCPFSHIVEPSGITRRIKEAATKFAEKDLRDFGGIVED
jgi:hypothetical protein